MTKKQVVLGNEQLTNRIYLQKRDGKDNAEKHQQRLCRKKKSER